MFLVSSLIDQATLLADAVAGAASGVVADAPPVNPAQAPPPAVAEKVATIISWLKWGALVAIFGTAVFGAGALAVGKVGGNYGASSAGTRALISAVVAAVVFAAIVPVYSILT